jgi:Hypoxia induced protein conserved region
MEIFINVAICLALFVVLAILGLGIYSVARGGEFNAKWGNRLMRYRVAGQAVAVGVLILGFWYKATH